MVQTRLPASERRGAWDDGSQYGEWLRPATNFGDSWNRLRQLTYIAREPLRVESQGQFASGVTVHGSAASSYHHLGAPVVEGLGQPDGGGGFTDATLHGEGEQGLGRVPWGRPYHRHLQK